MKPLPLKRVKKQDRELRVLFGLIELYIEMGKPVGSHTLLEHGFSDLSSATIRNYCAKLEELGLLTQQHSSGGRIPTDAAFRLYAKENFEASAIDNETEQKLHILHGKETKEPAFFLNQATELLSQITNLVAFVSSPRFDHDFILDIKLVAIDARRCLVVLVTNFGLVQTETLYTAKKLSAFSLKRLENYFLARLHGKVEMIPTLDKMESELAEYFYHEVMVRYIVGQANFTEQDITQSGFSKLLSYPELGDPSVLAASLSLFENRRGLANLLADTMKGSDLSIRIGNDLENYTHCITSTSVITIPYYLNRSVAGAVGVLGPTRVPYKKLIAILKVFSSYISDSLTGSLYKFKLHYRKPQAGRAAYLEQEDRLLLEDKRNNYE